MASDTRQGETRPQGPPDSDPPLYKFGSSDERVRSLVHSLGLVVAAFVVGIALAIIGIRLLATLNLVSGTADALPASVQAIAAALQFVGFIIVGLWYLKWQDSLDLFDIRIPSVRDFALVVAGIVSLFVLLGVVSAIIEFLGVQTAENAAVEQGRQQPVLFLYLIAVTIFLTAPAEELIFRGLVQGLFRSAYGLVPGVLITSILFGVVHYFALTGGGSRFSYIAVAAVLGVVLGVLYELSENLAVPIVVHGVYNAILFSMVYLVTTGQIDVPM